MAKFNYAHFSVIILSSYKAPMAIIYSDKSRLAIRVLFSSVNASLQSIRED